MNVLWFTYNLRSVMVLRPQPLSSVLNGCTGALFFVLKLRFVQYSPHWHLGPHSIMSRRFKQSSPHAVIPNERSCWLVLQSHSIFLASWLNLVCFDLNYLCIFRKLYMSYIWTKLCIFSSVRHNAVRTSPHFG